MSEIPPQYTTEPNNMPAPLWAGEGKYWNPAYLKHVQRRDAREKRQAAAAEAPVKVTADQWNGSYPSPPKQRICAVESCQRPFTPTAPRQRTCGSEDCKKERKRQTTASWYRDTKKEQVA